MSTKPKPVVEKEVCGTCAYYHQHYVLIEGGRFLALWYGHCRNPRPKYKQPDETCTYWKEAERKEGADTLSDW